MVQFQAIILIAEPALGQTQFDSLLSLVSPQKQDRIKRFRSFKDAQNCLLGDILTRMELSRLTGLRNDELEFAVNEHGKPYLANNPQIYHNLSHSGHYVALAIDDEPVGIDIELIKPYKERVAERFFTADEIAYIKSSDEIQRLESFFEIWTKKESRIKLDGKGLSMPLTSFSVHDLNEKESITYHEAFHNEEAICHVCTAKKNEPAVRVINTTQAIGQFCMSHLQPTGDSLAQRLQM